MKIDSSKTKFESVYKTETPPVRKKLAAGEVFTHDDFESVRFDGFNNSSRSKASKVRWARETEKLARKSIFFNALEVPLKIISHFVTSEDEDSMWSNIWFAAERGAEVLSSKYRNTIYAREDDNLGAEEFASEHFGDTTTKTLGKTNNFIQTKLRFIFPVIGLFNRNIGNTLDWLVSDIADSSWWRNMSLNSSFFPGFMNMVKSKVLGQFSKNKNSNNESNSSDGELTWDYFKGHIKQSISDSKAAWREFKGLSTNSPEKRESLLSFAQKMDDATSAIVPLIGVPVNILGDIARPVTRMLGVTGFLRTTSRVLSVADRGLAGVNYLFKHYLPLKIHEDERGNTNPFRASNIYMASLVGDVLDVPLALFKDQISNLGPVAKHGTKIFRIAKDILYNSFWSARRVSIAQDTLNDLEVGVV